MWGLQEAPSCSRSSQDKKNIRPPSATGRPRKRAAKDSSGLPHVNSVTEQEGVCKLKAHVRGYFSNQMPVSSFEFQVSSVADAGLDVGKGVLRLRSLRSLRSG